MKTIAPIIMLTLFSLIIPQQSVAASQAKAGAKCKKVNSTQTVGGKKFTCIKSGSKFIWNRGVTLPKPAAPTATLPTTEPAPTDFQMPAPMILQVLAQTRSEPPVYINDVPKARQLIRWPKQDSSWGPAKLVIVYENLSTRAVPCDLSKALCQPDARVDTTVYMKIIEDIGTEMIILENLEMASYYLYGVHLVIGKNAEFDKLKLTRVIPFSTTSEIVPDAPLGVTVGTTT